MALVPSHEYQSAVRVDTVTIAALFDALFLLLPLADLVSQTFAGGWHAALDALKDHDAFVILLALNVLQMLVSSRR
jgi:ABC-type sulfate transport system permease subunit